MLNCHKSPETPPWRRTDDEEIMADDGGHAADGQELLENVPLPRNLVATTTSPSSCLHC
jgi:hypothetical protein